MKRNFMKYSGLGILSVIFGFYTANAEPFNNSNRPIKGMKTERKIKNPNLETRIEEYEPENKKEGKKECSLSVFYGHINNSISSTGANFYFIGSNDLGIGLEVNQYEKDVYGTQYYLATERMVQLDASMICRLNPGLSAEIGLKSFHYDDKFDSGLKLSMKGKIPLNKNIKFYFKPDMSFLKDKTITDIYGGFDFDITSDFGVTGGYSSMSSSSEPFESLSGPFIGLKYNF